MSQIYKKESLMSKEFDYFLIPSYTGNLIYKLTVSRTLEPI